MSHGDDPTGYVVPSYRAAEDEAWFHFLHGNVPGHQIDFMYRADVPQGRLTRQHFSHLSRLMKYIEPQTDAPYAFAIGNLSRDDTQHEPGHGGLALLFGLRIRGVTDHAGRQDPPFSHGIAIIDRELDAATILAAAGAFQRRVFGAAESAEWYRAYVRCALEVPAEVPQVFAGYVGSFADLPRPAESTLSTRWIASDTTRAKARVVVVHPDDAPFELIARTSARIASMLYPSDVKWTAISNGREADLPGGVSVRFVAESALTPADEKLKPWWIGDVPEDEGEIARQLFAANPAEKAKPATRNWRDRYSAVADAPSADGSSVDIPMGRSSWEGHAPPARPRSERPPPGYTPPAALKSTLAPRVARPSVEVEAAWKSLPAGDLDGETEHWPHRQSAPTPSPPERRSVDDEAVTVGAPMQRDEAPPAAAKPAPAANGAARAPAGDDIDVSVEDEDGGGRRASFDLMAPAIPPAAPTDEAATVTSGFQRETMQISPEELKRTLAEALPFRPASVPAPPLVAPPLPPVASPSAAPPQPEAIPDFRGTSGAWKWVVALAIVAGVVIGGLYLAFADPAAPTPAPAGSGSASAGTATPSGAASAAPTAPPTTTTAPTATGSAAPAAPPGASAAPTTDVKKDPARRKPPPIPAPDNGGAFNPHKRIDISK
jgi:hypothetical protein